MRFLSALCLCVALVQGCAPDVRPVKTLQAVDDFSYAADSGIYIDEKLGVLAINASNPQYRNVFLSAQHKADWVTTKQTYRAQLDVIAENDGESRYTLSVNGVALLRGVAPETEEVFIPGAVDLGNVTLSPGDMIAIASEAVTNGKIPEGDGTAFSRGRWSALRLSPAG